MDIETIDRNEIRSLAYSKLKRMLSADINLKHHESIKTYTALFLNSNVSDRAKLLIKIQYIDYLIKLLDYKPPNTN